MVAMAGRTAMLLCALLAAPAGCAGETIWGTAAEARQGMEFIVSEQVKKIQDYINEVITTGGLSIEDLCPLGDGRTQPMCDVNAVAFQDANTVQIPQFLEPGTKTCTNLDLDECGYVIDSAVTGRETQGDYEERKESCRAPQIKDCGGDPSYAAETRYDTLNSQSCTSEGEKGKCRVNISPDIYGYSYPESAQHGKEETLSLS